MTFLGPNANASANSGSAKDEQREPGGAKRRRMEHPVTVYEDVPVDVADPDQWMRKQELLAGVVSGDWLSRQMFPPLQYAVPGIVPEGLTILAGAPKLGKSWMVLGIGLAVAGGGKALGHLQISEPRSVLYLALEDGHRRLQERCKTLQLGGGEIPKKLDFLTEVRPGYVRETLEAWVERQGPNSTIIIDTAGKIMPPPIAGESAYARDYRFGGALKKIADDNPGLTLVVVHHTRKARGGDWLEDTSGTNGLPGSADSVLVLDRARSSSDGILKVTGRDIVEAEYALTSHNGIWRLQGDSLNSAAARATEVKVTDNLGVNSVAIVEYVNRVETGVRAAQVASALGLEVENVKRTLARLEDAGRVCKPERGLYTPVPSVPTVPFTGSEGTHGTQGTHTGGGSQQLCMPHERGDS